MLHDGREIMINPPDQSATSIQLVHPEPIRAKIIGAGARPLGEVAFARCGDKGGNSNIGIWASSDEAWPSLRSTLSTEKFRELFPDTRDKRISHHEFPT